MELLWVEPSQRLASQQREGESARPKLDFCVGTVKAAQSLSDDFRPPERPVLGRVHLQWGVKYCLQAFVQYADQRGQGTHWRWL